VLDWKSLESPYFDGYVQLTSRDRFVKAGEAYFDHSSPSQWVIFQAVEVPKPGAEVDPFYAMYVAKLTRDAAGIVNGIEEPVRVSPPGSANTCGWFHPTDPTRVLYGSTIITPGSDQPSGFQVGTRRYVWMFPQEMDIVEQRVFDLSGTFGSGGARTPLTTMPAPTRLFERPAYDAECSYSKDGRFVLYARIREDSSGERPDADIYVHDNVTKTDTPLVTATGYDGGPFFSADEKYICYRSDRKGDDLLQIFVSELKYEQGRIVGITREHQLTDNGAVNWAPYFHPSGKFLVYGSSEVGHHNYEVFAAPVDMTRPASEIKRVRITQADGADVLPVFSDDGSLMMWTAQRGPLAPGESKPSSQVWIARVRPGSALAEPERLFR
jgi:hypothetical protein